MILGNQLILTPKQVRAGRALLAWSQQDLAKAAGVATSTVADFERGQRTPVPNNADAIKDALESAGINFPPGGAVAGPPIPGLVAANKSGHPIRWVNATDISHWAEQRGTQGSLSTLLSKLVRATGPASLHFPSDEGVQFGGWDGTTDARVESEYLPLGKSGWEIGTQREGISKKASDDYNKRTKTPGALNPADSTFIFVTPRHWPGKDEWASEKRAQRIWQDVRAYDGTDLVHWIEMYPAIGQWLAAKLGKRPLGAHQLEEIWQEWSLATRWPLTPELILSDRDKNAVSILRWLRSDPASLALQGETAEEVASFVYAAITQLPIDTAEHYLARCLAATTPDVARTLADSLTPLIIVLLDPEPGLAQAIAKKGHHVLLAYGGNPSLSRDVQQLERPLREGIEAALKDAGLPDELSLKLARESSRSLAILRRLIPSQAGRLSTWAQSTAPRGLFAALLAGAWDEDTDGDRHIVARIANMSYDTFVAEIAPFTGHFDSPLRKVGTIWKVASPKDAWSLLAPYLSPADVDRFDAAAIDVLGAADPRYEMAPEERWYAPINGVKPEYSQFLRHGLGEVLIMLALFGDRAHTVTGASRRTNEIVRRLLRDADGQRWWSLSRDFQLLAEASPEVFFDAIERSLDQDPPPIAALFGSDDTPIFSTEHLSNLLWALESLAWAPEYLGRVSDILARLDAIDPGGRNGNRPSNSLRHIFVLWSPQTNANLDERLKVLDCLRRKHSTAAWKLMLGILPSGHDFQSPAATTRWRDLTGDQEIVTYALVDKGAREIAERLLEDVGANENRWATLLDRLGDLPDHAAVIEQLSKTIPKIIDEDARMVLWDKLRRLLNHHRQFSDANWSLPESELANLELTYSALTPHDPIKTVSWIFEPGAALPNPAGGWQDNEQQVAAERRKIATQVCRDLGIDGVFALANILKNPETLGTALVEGKLEGDTINQVLERSLRSGQPQDHHLAHGVIVTAFYGEKETWAEKLFAKTLRENLGDESVLTILLALPSNRWSWGLAGQAGAAVELSYWQRMHTFRIQAEGIDVEFAVSKLVEVGRARHAVHFIGSSLQKNTVPLKVLISTLLAAVRQPWSEDGDRNEPVMFQYYAVELLKRLDEAEDISADTMLALEWAYMPLLEHSERPAKVIMKALAEKPELFMQLICAVFKPSDDSGVVEEPPADLERAQNIATQSYNLLRQWSVVPGTTIDGKLDGVALENWVREARKLAKAAGRGEIADQKIGEILAASPIGDDDIWPPLPVRELIENVRSEHIQTGIVIGHRNRRGVTTRLPRDGGKQEHDLAERYRQYSKATALEWYRTSAVLEDIAKGYEEDARWHDESAERLDW